MTITRDEAVPREYEQPYTVNPLSRWLSERFPMNWETWIYIAILLLAIFTRFYILGARTMSHDESLHTKFSWDLYTNGVFQHTPLMHGPILFHITALDYFLFGDNDFTARIYPAVLGVLMCMFPLLLRRWLGRWGSILASLMFLISPLIMYYNRYIREDTPSIFYTLIMVYCTFMYLNGPVHLRRKARWLYIFAGAMLASMATKEVAFMYIAIFGSFLTLYWLVRVGQYFFKLPGKSIMYFLSIVGLIGGLAAIFMYVVLSVDPLDTALSLGQGTVEFASLIKWTLVIVIIGVFIVVRPMVWTFWRSRARMPWLDVLLMLALTVVAAAFFILVEERSHAATQDAAQAVTPAVPGQAADAAAGVIYKAVPFYLFWILCIVIILGVLYSWRAGWWRKLHRFPEFDILVVMGTLVLPWLTPLIMKAMGANTMSMPSIAAAVQAALPIQFDQSLYGMQIFLSALPVIPAIAVAVVVGLVWDRKRWLISAAIFHALFVFFFTTVFTNIQGIGTGMIGSLGYWLEQQAVRRGSQPQYYYILIILPFYEFLPIIGSILAMFAGLTAFWRFRRDRLEEKVPVLADASPEGLGFELENGERVVEVAPQTEVTEIPPGIGWRRSSAEWLHQLPILLFISWWAIFNIIAYTLAGEKMPWLGTHMTTPMIFLAAWYFGGFVERIDAAQFWKRTWVFLLLIPVMFVALAQVAAPFIFTSGPGGLETAQLTRMFQWFGGILIAGIIGYVLYRLVQKSSWAQLRIMITVSAFFGLAFLTFRSAWMASFINYDDATEFLVYAHGGPANKRVEEELETLSRQITGGMDLKFAYDFKISWPGAWYFRNFKNATFMGENPSPHMMDDAAVVIVGDENRAAVQGMLEDRYFSFDYIRMWWPMQDYFGLTPQRIINTFDFSPDNTQAAQIRQGMFDIWWSRDYTTYGTALNKDFSLTKWPVADRMYVFVRKDIAAQIWNLGVGDGSAGGGVYTTVDVNQCNANWQPTEANQVLNINSSTVPPFNHPRQISIAPDGRIYAAEEGSHRVSVFNSDGSFVFTFGTEGTGPGQFERPNGVAVGPSGKVYVADTWNYRIQVFTAEGEYITSWGQRGEYGAAAQPQPFDGFWGPRAVAVDAQENVYVADTGNKRIRVYTSDGQYLRDIGSGGSGNGQLDEPSGVLVSSTNLLYVADTWNRRISVFNLDGTPANIFQTTDGQPSNNFRVRGWIDDLGNRPYLAVDTARSLIYVTDPDAGRVLVFSTSGECVGSFGQLSRENPNIAQFSSIGGILTDSQGNVYVADADAGRILRFIPFSAPVQPAVNPPGQVEGQQSNSSEVTPEVGAPVNLEISPEVTPEATDGAVG